MTTRFFYAGAGLECRQGYAFRQNDVCCRKRDTPFDHVFKLTDISREIIAAEHVKGIGRKLVDLLVHLS